MTVNLKITEQNITTYYETFLKEYHSPTDVNGKQCTITDHISKFTNPPRLIGKAFHPYRLYTYVLEIGGMQEVNTY